MTEKLPYWIFLADVHAGDIPGALTCREEDIYHAFQLQCQLAANDPSCLGIIGGGDLRDKPSMQARNVDGFNTGIEILHNAGKVLLALVGNHDMTTPTWIKAMHHPALKSLSDPIVMQAHGLDPKTTLASDYKNKEELKTWFESLGETTRTNAKTVFLHLALADLCAANQKAETSLEELKALGFGKNGPVTFFIGDLHNYGDVSLDKIEAVYPGSLEMTDRNEGVNGFKSTRYPTMKPEFAKFVLHWVPKGPKGEPEWERIPLKPRPWYYVKISKNKEKKTGPELEMALKAVSKWTSENPGILNLILPEKELENAAKPFQTLKTEGKILQINLEAYSKEIHGSEDEDEIPPPSGNGSWTDTKALLPDMAKSSKLSPEALSLLSELIASDGSTHSPKGDVTNAWDKWKNPPTSPDKKTL